MGKFRKYSFGSDCPRICIIGAGFSGLCAAIQLKRKLNFTDFTVYDSNDEVGGCWLSNRYPGSACSIPSIMYNYSFAPKSDWSHQYAGQPEILEYLKSTAKKYDIYKNVQLKCEVKKLVWIEKLGKWNVRVYNKQTNIESETLYDIVINGTGQLRIPQKPKEFQQFQGPVIHTAEWDDTVVLEGKTVAVVGAGASAIQLIPSIGNKVSKLLCYQRNPIWVFAGVQFNYPNFIKWAFAHVPALRSTLRSTLFLTTDIVGTRMINPGPKINSCARSVVSTLCNLFSGFVLRKTPELRDALQPTHPIFCKVPGLSDDYYSTFKRQHVKLIKNKITEVTGTSIVTEDGNEEKIDVILLATGFRSQDFFAPMEIIGKNSINILSKWKANGPSAYLGIMSCDMPNTFFLFGPGTTVLHTSLIFQIECQVHYVIEVLMEMMKQRARVVTVKKSAEFEYMRENEEAMKKTVFGQPDCIKVASWYLDSRMVNTAIYPRSCRSYRNRTKRVEESKYDFI